MISKPTYDHVFRNALLYDGTGTPPFAGELGISGERIAAIGVAGSARLDAGATEHDLGGRALAPGFIDTHTHDDRILIDAPEMLAKVSQGVTTVIAGNCGISLAPVTFRGDPPPPMNLLGDRDVYKFPSFSAYAAAVRETVPAVNVAALVGHSALRLASMSDTAGPAQPAELDAMLDHVEEAMENGATGLSSGLFYAPNAGADIEETAALAARVAAAGGVYAIHMRDEGDRVLESITETLEIANRASIPVIISHHKCAGPRNWGRTCETLPIIAEAARGQPVGLDAYPYTAGSTVLNPDLVADDYRIMIAWSRAHPAASGRDLKEIAREWGVDLAEAARRLDPAGAIYFQMDEEDVRRVLSFPLTMIGSDGLPHDDHPHPRLYGTFPRVIGRYAREIGLFPIEAAIHKMTGLPAAAFRLKDRGCLAAGYFADLVAFDPEGIIDRATYEEPRRLAAGIDLVFVNGRLAWEPKMTSVNRAGRLVGGRFDRSGQP
jgi:N-acyl-D-amino-acid deacylase